MVIVSKTCSRVTRKNIASDGITGNLTDYISNGRRTSKRIHPNFLFLFKPIFGQCGDKNYSSVDYVQLSRLPPESTLLSFASCKNRTLSKVQKINNRTVFSFQEKLMYSNFFATLTLGN
jgi:hypothetical protein